MKGTTGTIVDLLDGFRKFFGGNDAEIRALREEFAQESIGLFVQSPLPCSVRLRTGHNDIVRGGNFFMLHNFTALVVGHRETKRFRDTGEDFCCRPYHLPRCLILKDHCLEVFGESLNECRNGTTASAATHHEITLPIAASALCHGDSLFIRPAIASGLFPSRSSPTTYSNTMGLLYQQERVSYDCSLRSSA